MLTLTLTEHADITATRVTSATATNHWLLDISFSPRSEFAHHPPACASIAVRTFIMLPPRPGVYDLYHVALGIGKRNSKGRVPMHTCPPLWTLRTLAMTARTCHCERSETIRPAHVRRTSETRRTCPLMAL
ncbi:MAG: hypothetical protein Kow00123_06820 [Anaerolineales bacterium]